MNKGGEVTKAAGLDPAANPTIGLLCEQLANEYSIGMWAGVRETVWEHGIRPLSFCGGTLMCPWGFEAQANMLYELVDAGNLDGLVQWGAQLAHRTTLEELGKFYERFRRVVINLVDNARQAIQSAVSAGGAKRILTVEAKTETQDLILAVTDTGPGIPPEVMPHLFEPLFSTKDFGAGLGLSVVKGIVEQHGGTISITSSAGTGTQAVIRLPLVRKENAHS